jgi:hypothetical protein
MATDGTPTWLTDFGKEIFAQLDGEWKTLSEISEGAGYGTLSGSGWETIADKLVADGRAEVEHRLGAPMGKVYRRAA